MIKEYLKDKRVGFWVSASLVLLTLITAIVYGVCYAGTENISWGAFAFLIVAAAGSAALIAFKQYKYVPYLQAILIFLSLLFFIYGIYYYVSVVMVGIDLDHFDPEFYACTILFVIIFAASVANVFLKQTKEVNTDAEDTENEKTAD